MNLKKRQIFVYLNIIKLFCCFLMEESSLIQMKMMDMNYWDWTK